MESIELEDCFPNIWEPRRMPTSEKLCSLQFDVLVEQMAEREGVIEQLKEENQMLWAQKMNNIRARAEEIVREEIIYCNG